MGKLILLFMLALAVILGLAAAPGIAQRLDDHNRYRAQLEAYKLDQQALTLEQARATLPGRIASDYGFMVLTLVGAGGILLRVRCLSAAQRAAGALSGAAGG